VVASIRPFFVLEVQATLIATGSYFDAAIHRKSTSAERIFRVARRNEFLTACSLAPILAPIVRNFSP
jgi:hypothetical protein